LKNLKNFYKTISTHEGYHPSNQRVRVLFAMSQYVLLPIQVIQEELEALKKMVIHHQTQIKGLWKDVVISDDDLEEAKKAVFRD